MYPPAGFHFRIIFKGLPGKKQTDTGFQSIEGLEATVTADESKDGKLTTEYALLVLTRAVRPVKDSPLIKWIFANIHQSKFSVLPEAKIQLLDEQHQPYMQWTIRNITPKSWKLGAMNAEVSGVLMETIELQYTELLAE